MWWPESSLTLLLGKSLAYQRVLMGLYGLSFYACYQLELSWIARLIIGLALMGHLLRFLPAAIPTGLPIELMYSAGVWRLIRKQQVERIEAPLLLLNVRFFLLLKVSLASGKRVVYVIFSDQLTPDQWRRLMWLL